MVYYRAEHLSTHSEEAKTRIRCAVRTCTSLAVFVARTQFIKSPGFGTRNITMSVEYVNWLYIVYIMLQI